LHLKITAKVITIWSFSLQVYLDPRTYHSWPRLLLPLQPSLSWSFSHSRNKDESTSILWF
jgi:hypothetical protein